LSETNIIQAAIVQVDSAEAIVRTKIQDYRGMLSAGVNDPKLRKKVYVSIRPECLRLGDFPSPENSPKSAIGNVTYFEEVLHFKVERQGVVSRISKLCPSHFTNMQNKSMQANLSHKDVIILEIDG
jgi:hypothetical protein